jgi:hypothetical protein
MTNNQIFGELKYRVSSTHSSRDASHKAQKALVLFRALRCGEPDEDTEALNFTTKIAPEGVRIELGSKESPDTVAPRSA